MVPELSVGQVSGLIALAVFIVTWYLPNALVFVLVGSLGHDNAATTWSVAAREIQSSYWPTILRSESAARASTKWSIMITVMSSGLLAALMTIVGVVTPLGLHEVVVDGDLQPLSFQFASDPSRFAISYGPNTSRNLTRICIGRMYLYACPYTPNNITVWEVDYPTVYYNITGNGGTVSTDIPETLKTRFTSGLKTVKETVSSLFDIQWRFHIPMDNKHFNGGKPYPVGTFNVINFKVLEEQPYLIHGLVVDGDKGGVGFRNHTVPLQSKHGVTWDEELLFWEPETKCVDLNFTIDFEVPELSLNSYVESKAQHIRLIDRGAFSSKRSPTPPPAPSERGMNEVDLYSRVLGTAWRHNEFLADMFSIYENNVTHHHYDPLKPAGNPPKLKSYLGKEFRCDTIPDPPGLIQVDASFTAASDSVPFPLFSPFDSTQRLADIMEFCRKPNHAEGGKISHAAVNCGVVMGMAQSKDKNKRLYGPSLTGNYSIPAYVCGSAIKAKLKTVTFALPALSGQKIPSVSDIEVKNIADTRRDGELFAPLWGVESGGPPIQAAPPLWGIIDEETARLSDVAAIRKPELYLPGYIDTLSTQLLTLLTPSRDNLPGSTLPATSLLSTYSVNSYMLLDSSFSNFLTYYFGTYSLALQKRWNALSTSPEKIAQIPNLIWTDLVAQAVMGDRGTLTFESASDPNNTTTMIKGKVNRSVVHINYYYAIPAFVAAICVVVITLFGISYLIIGKSNLNKVRAALRQTSAGRLLTSSERYPHGSLQLREMDWKSDAGKRVYDLGGLWPISGSSGDAYSQADPNKINGGAHFYHSSPPGTATSDHYIHNPPHPLYPMAVYTSITSRTPVAEKGNDDCVTTPEVSQSSSASIRTH